MMKQMEDPVQGNQIFAYRSSNCIMSKILRPLLFWTLESSQLHRGMVELEIELQ